MSPIPFPTHDGADYRRNTTQYEEDRPRVGNAGDSGGCGEEGKDVDRDTCRCATGSEEEGRLKRGVADGFDEEWTEDCHAAVDLIRKAGVSKGEKNESETSRTT